MGTVKVIARITGLVAIWHLVRHYLNSSETHIDKPHSKDQKQNEGTHISTGLMSNSNALEWRKPILENVMVALADPNTHLIGVYGSHDNIKDTLLQRVHRRVQRDKLFDTILTATVTKKPDVRSLQEDIARQLGFAFNQKSKDKRANKLLHRIKEILRRIRFISNQMSDEERANQLIHRIKNEQKILIVLNDLSKGLDLCKAGIPYGADHTGCKMLLTSTTEEVLSNQMHTQINFMV